MANTGTLQQSAPRKLPVGIQSFEKIIENHNIYVDKTEYIDSLAGSGKQYFLSRPRRFGKSLLLSTFRAYWEGKQDLFAGLQIARIEAQKERPWKKHPVFYFDFNGKNYQQENALEDVLDMHLREWENVYGDQFRNRSLEERFQKLLVMAYTQSGERCVVLVDEYDKPLLEVMHDPEREDHNKAVFKGFFSILKSADELIQFVFITGVTKFSKISIFSDLNQLNDISFSRAYAGICGITEEEMTSEFLPEIMQMAENLEISSEECIEKLRSTYDGYCFHQNAERVYNPFSLLKALYEKEFGFYWFETGTPTFLVRKLKAINFDVRQFTNHELFATERMLSDYHADNPDPIPLLFQTGYLTIGDYNKAGDYYILSVPNDEVKYGLLESLMPEYMPASEAVGNHIIRLKRCAETGNTSGMRDILTALFASLPYTGADDPFENYFQSVLYIVFTLLGQYIRTEVQSAHGRADCVLETEKFIYLFEFKRNGSAEEALTQIEEKGYANSYLADDRTLYKIEISFDTNKRSLKEWKEKKVDPRI